MKDFLKMLALVEFLVIVVYGCIWVVSQFTGDACPLIVLPIAMVCVFGVVVLSMIIQPIAEWWLS